MHSSVRKGRLSVQRKILLLFEIEECLFLSDTRCENESEREREESSWQFGVSALTHIPIPVPCPSSHRGCPFGCQTEQVSIPTRGKTVSCRRSSQSQTPSLVCISAVAAAVADFETFYNRRNAKKSPGRTEWRWELWRLTRSPHRPPDDHGMP